MSRPSFATQQSLKVAVLGPPGSGKTEQCKLISLKNGIVHLKISSIISRAISAGTLLGQQAGKFLDGHSEVPDDLIRSLVVWRLSDVECSSGWVLEGFPRTVADVEFLRSHSYSLSPSPSSSSPTPSYDDSLSDDSDETSDSGFLPCLVVALEVPSPQTLQKRLTRSDSSAGIFDPSSFRKSLVGYRSHIEDVLDELEEWGVFVARVPSEGSEAGSGVLSVAERIEERIRGLDEQQRDEEEDDDVDDDQTGVRSDSSEGEIGGEIEEDRSDDGDGGGGVSDATEGGGGESGVAMPDQPPRAILTQWEVRGAGIGGPPGVAATHTLLLPESYTGPLQVIGVGQFGIVVHGREAGTRRAVAIKLIKGLRGSPFASRSPLEREKSTFRFLSLVLRELLVLEFIGKKCPFVVPMVDLCPIDGDADSFDEIALVMPYAGCSLWQALHARVGKKKEWVSFTDAEVKRHTYQMLCALKFLHSGGILHRDLKCGNVCWNQKHRRIRILDFGFARGVDLGGALGDEDAGILIREQMSTHLVCTNFYRPPELFFGDKTAHPGIDIWSTGCIMAELLMPPDPRERYGRRVLFEGQTEHEIIGRMFSYLGRPKHVHELKGNRQKVRKYMEMFKRMPSRNLESSFPPETNPLALDLLARMLRYDPDDRISVEDALEHEYLRDVRRERHEVMLDHAFPFRLDKLKMKYLDRGVTLNSDALRQILYKKVCEWNYQKHGYVGQPERAFS